MTDLTIPESDRQLAIQGFHRMDVQAKEAEASLKEAQRFAQAAFAEGFIPAHLETAAGMLQSAQGNADRIQLELSGVLNRGAIAKEDADKIFDVVSEIRNRTTDLSVNIRNAQTLRDFLGEMGVLPLVDGLRFAIAQQIKAIEAGIRAAVDFGKGVGRFFGGLLSFAELLIVVALVVGAIILVKILGD